MIMEFFRVNRYAQFTQLHPHKGGVEVVQSILCPTLHIFEVVQSCVKGFFLLPSRKSSIKTYFCIIKADFFCLLYFSFWDAEEVIYE